MSHRGDESSYEDVDFDSEGIYRQDLTQLERDVSEEVPYHAYTTQTVARQPSVLISNKDIMEQLYHIGDALNSFEERLGTVQLWRRRYSHHRRNHHRPGKELM